MPLKKGARLCLLAVLGIVPFAGCESESGSSCEELVPAEFRFVEVDTNVERLGSAAPLQIMEGRSIGDPGFVTLTWAVPIDDGFELGVAARFAPSQLLDHGAITVDVTRFGLEVGKANVTRWNGSVDTLHQPHGGLVEFNVDGERLSGRIASSESQLNGAFDGPFPGSVCFRWNQGTGTWLVDGAFESQFCSQFAAFREARTSPPRCATEQ